MFTTSCHLSPSCARQTQLVHMIPSYFFNINFNIIIPSTRKSSKWSLLHVSSQSPACIYFSTIHAIYFIHLILLDLITLTVFGVKYKFTIQCPHLPQHPILKYHVCSCLNVRDKDPEVHKTTDIIVFLCSYIFTFMFLNKLLS